MGLSSTIGFTVYTAKDNERMIKRFHSLDCTMAVSGQGEMIHLEALFTRGAAEK